MKTLSFVIPCYNEEANLGPLTKAIALNIPRGYRYEIILVDDGSKDGTAKVITQLAERNQRIKGVILYRNFGHQAALFTGMRFAKGDAVIMMDADFQHPPEIPEKND